LGEATDEHFVRKLKDEMRKISINPLSLRDMSKLSAAVTSGQGANKTAERVRKSMIQ
jgi:hypothetical protein